MLIGQASEKEVKQVVNSVCSGGSPRPSLLRSVPAKEASDVASCDPHLSRTRECGINRSRLRSVEGLSCGTRSLSGPQGEIQQCVALRHLSSERVTPAEQATTVSIEVLVPEMCVCVLDRMSTRKQCGTCFLE